jgi:hypothetical protein
VEIIEITYVHSQTHHYGPSFAAYGLAVLSGVLANIICDEFLADLGQTWGSLNQRKLWLRLGRWLAMIAGCVVALGTSDPTEAHARMIGVALFGVVAGCDLESSHVPPDWYTIGGTVGMVCAWGLAGGVKRMGDAALAQAFCYGIMVFGITVFRVAAGGDIKLMMQYGAALGAIPAVGWAFAIEWVVRVVWMFGWAIRVSARNGIDEMVRLGRDLRAPHGPFAWLGVMGWIILF